jgi:serine phosphatase RsbU (regulator of sigma subunit)
MMPVETSTTGAKVQSFRRQGPRDLLRRIIEEEPTLNKTDLLLLFRAEVRKDEDMLDVVIDYSFMNTYHSLNDQRHVAQPVQLPQPRKDAQAAIELKAGAIKQKLNQHIQQEAQRILLDMTMPNGRQLRHCTFGYLAKLGSAYSRIAEKGRPRQEVGSVLNETQVRKLYGPD